VGIDMFILKWADILRLKTAPTKTEKKDIWNINAGNYAEKDIFI